MTVGRDCARFPLSARSARQVIGACLHHADDAPDGTVEHLSLDALGIDREEEVAGPDAPSRVLWVLR